MTAGLRILEGPVTAGVGPGDVVVVEEGELFAVTLTPRGIDLTPQPRVPAPHAVLLRFVDGGWREEGGGDIKPVGREVIVDAWRFELVDDVAVVDTVRRFAADRFVVVRPRRVFHANVVTSWWTALHEDGRVQDVVWTDAARLVPLCRGVPLEQLASHGTVDDGIARAIVQQMGQVRGRPVVCWDGIVRAIDPRPQRNDDRRVAFAGLVGMTPGKDDAHTVWWKTVMDRYQRTRAATVVDVAAFVRSFDAAGYARHLALFEELELWRLADERERAARAADQLALAAAVDTAAGSPADDAG